MARDAELPVVLLGNNCGLWTVVALIVEVTNEKLKFSYLSAILRAPINTREVAKIDSGRLYSIEDINKTLGVSTLGLLTAINYTLKTFWRGKTFKYVYP